MPLGWVETSLVARVSWPCQQCWVLKHDFRGVVQERVRGRGFPRARKRERVLHHLH